MRKKQRLQLIIQIFLRKEGIPVLDKLNKETKPALAKPLYTHGGRYFVWVLNNPENPAECGNWEEKEGGGF